MSFWSKLAKIGGAVAAPFTGGVSAWLPAAIGAGAGIGSGLLAGRGGGGGSSPDGGSLKQQQERMIGDLYGRTTGLGQDITGGATRLGATTRTPEYRSRLGGIIGKPAGYSQDVTSGIASLPTTRGPEYGNLLKGIIGTTGYSPELTGFYGDLMREGLSPETRSAISQESQSTLDPTFDAARQAITRQATITGRNDAGTAAAIGELGRDEARARAEVARRNAIDFESEGLRRRLLGAEGTLGLEEGERGRQERGLGYAGEAADTEFGRLLSRLSLQTGAEDVARAQELENLGLEGEPQEFELRNLLQSLGIKEGVRGQDMGLLSSMTGQRTSLEQPSIWRTLLPQLLSGGAQVASGLGQGQPYWKQPVPKPTFEPDIFGRY